MSEPRFPSEVGFASFFVYNPSRTRWPSELSANSRKLCGFVKRETTQFAEKKSIALRIKRQLGQQAVSRFLGDNTTLVPMPGHAPMKDPRSHWPARKLCESFVANGLGKEWLSLLSRDVAVNKSAFSKSDERPSLEEHYESMRAEWDIMAGSVITVVDDVITAGTTMFAAVTRLCEVFPEADIRGFALIRTMSSEEVENLITPCVGTIERVPWGTKRRP